MRKLAVLLAGAVLLTGCGSRTTLGVAARIGDETVELSTFADRVARAYENEQFADQQPKEEYQRRLLNDLILSRLVDIAADRLGVRVTQQDIDRRIDEVIQSYGGREAFERLLPTRGFHPDDVPSVIRSELLQAAVLDKLVEDVNVTEAQLRAEYRRQLPQLDVAEIAHILVHDARTAARVARLAKAPGANFVALAKRWSEDVDTKEDGGELGRLGNGEGRFAKEFERAVFAARTGDVIGPIRVRLEGVPNDTAYEIVHVVRRDTRSFADARLDLRRSILRDQRVERFNTLVGDLARELGVKVNPRFGRWDAQRLGVIATDGGGLSSPAPVPGQDAGVAPPQGGQPGQPGQPQPGQPQPGQPGQPQGGQPGQPTPGAQ